MLRGIPEINFLNHVGFEPAVAYLVLVRRHYHVSDTSSLSGEIDHFALNDSERASDAQFLRFHHSITAPNHYLLDRYDPARSGV